MDQAHRQGTPPAELTLSWQCERWHTLPDAGGMLDQEYRLMRMMTVTSNVYNTVTKLERAQGAQIHQLTDNERLIIRWLMETGVYNNG